MSDEKNGIHFGWFLAGLGLGALIGVLYAPKSGRETREELLTGAKEGTEYLRNRSKEAVEKVAAFVDDSKSVAGEYVERGKEAMGRGRAQWDEFVERGKGVVTEQAERISAAVDAGREAYHNNTTEKHS
jgi:gas vesicle protein